MSSLGLRHLALNVKDVARSKDFYCGLLGMAVEWEPDPQNAYLTTASQDNLALHEKPDLIADPDRQILDHFGFIMSSPAEVDVLHETAVKRGVSIVAPPKKHRDGAYSFYMRDPDGIVVQPIYHPPIVGKI